MGLWEAMLLADDQPLPKREQVEQPDMQEYIRNQLEKEGYDASGVRLENLSLE